MMKGKFLNTSQYDGLGGMKYKGKGNVPTYGPKPVQFADLKKGVRKGPPTLK